MSKTFDDSRQEFYFLKLFAIKNFRRVYSKEIFISSFLNLACVRPLVSIYDFFVCLIFISSKSKVLLPYLRFRKLLQNLNQKLKLSCLSMFGKTVSFYNLFFVPVANRSLPTC